MLKNLKVTIRARLYASAALSLVAMLGLGALDAYSVRQGTQALASVYEGQVSALLALNEADGDLKEIRFRMAAYAIDQMPAVGNNNHLAEVRQRIPVAWESFKNLSHAGDDAQAKPLVEKADAQLGLLPAFYDRLEAAYDADDKEKVTAMLEDEWPAIHAGVVKPIGQLLPMQQKAAKQIYEASAAEGRQLFALAGIVVLIASIVLLFFTFLLVRAVTRPLHAAVGIAKSIAEGDLSARIAVTSKDETGELMSALQAMNSSLGEIVSHVRTSTRATGTAISEMAAGNTGLSQRTEEQASSLEETAATMEELTASAKQNAEGANHGMKLATRAAAVAVKGGDVVGRVVGTMDSIDTSSKRVVEIISVIDGIAFQTNILALNAAVEAARAGEHGRGFAVVASEVRSLAQRSAEAAKEIKALIGSSAAQVEDGTKLVKEAGQTMSEIVSSIKQVEEIMARIAAASNEQASGIEQVNQTLAQMDNATQQNAALVEQATASVEALQHQAQDLSRTVSVFKLVEAESPLDAAVPESGEPAGAAETPAVGTLVESKPSRMRRRLRPALQGLGQA